MILLPLGHISIEGQVEFAYFVHFPERLKNFYVLIMPAPKVFFLTRY